MAGYIRIITRHRRRILPGLANISRSVIEINTSLASWLTFYKSFFYHKPQTLPETTPFIFLP
jgi:hypothetical protein